MLDQTLGSILEEMGASLSMGIYPASSGNSSDLFFRIHHSCNICQTFGNGFNDNVTREERGSNEFRTPEAE